MGRPPVRADRAAGPGAAGDLGHRAGGGAGALGCARAGPGRAGADRGHDGAAGLDPYRERPARGARRAVPRASPPTRRCCSSTPSSPTAGLPAVRDECGVPAGYVAAGASVDVAAVQQVVRAHGRSLVLLGATGAELAGHDPQHTVGLTYRVDQRTLTKAPDGTDTERTDVWTARAAAESGECSGTISAQTVLPVAGRRRRPSGWRACRPGTAHARSPRAHWPVEDVPAWSRSR